MKIPIVNENDEVIEYKEFNERKKDELFRASGLWVTDRDGNILLAQRGFNKKYNPGRWGPAVAGTVEEGETYESNIIKEAEEEIGLKGIEPILGPKIKLPINEYFGQWFTVVVDRDYPFKKADDEVESIRWFSRDELEKLLEEKPEIFLREFRKYMDMF